MYFINVVNKLLLHNSKLYTVTQELNIKKL